MTKTIHTEEYLKIISRVKQARIDACLTQKEVAQKIQRPQSYISKIESGEQRLDIIELKLLSRIYKKDINYFI